MAAAKTVCVTGATGFTAAQTVKQLLERGYRVHGTCRSLDPAKTQHLTCLPGAQENLKLFKADLLHPGAFDEPIAGCAAVFHMASPFFVTKENSSSVNSRGEQYNEENLLKPAVDGTLNVLRSCQKHIPGGAGGAAGGSGAAAVSGGNATGVKKVLLTSSTASVYCDYGSRPGDHVYTEADWSDETKMRERKFWYALSKQLAEKAAFDFVAQHRSNVGSCTSNSDDGSGIIIGGSGAGRTTGDTTNTAAGDAGDRTNAGTTFELVTLLPTMIIGEPLQPSLNTSNKTILDILNGKKKKLPNECRTVVDVKDVALAHILAYEKPGFEGRVLLIADTPHWSEIGKSLKKICPGEKRMPLVQPEHLQKMSAENRQMGPPPPMPYGFDCGRAEGELGMKFRGVGDMLRDTVEGLRRWGHYDG